jgi:dipicolinate synthase subunit A
LNIKIFVVGGDLRLSYAYKELSEKGFDVSYTGCPALNDIKPDNIDETFKNADVFIFGVPMSKDGLYLDAPFCDMKIKLSQISEKIDSNKLVFGGKIPHGLFNCKTFDFLERDDFAFLNAVPTAEGVLEIAIRETDFTISGCKCLVTGFGRIGKIISAKFKALGSQVSVSARKSGDLAFAEALGFDTIHTSKIHRVVHDYDIIVNTVPQPIFTHEVLQNIKAETLIIDTASKPGGVDIKTAQSLGINVIWALSLPGKTAPHTAGRIICDTTINILSEINIV